ncbi:jg1157, partial [Pararge aegeria aegeria]
MGFESKAGNGTKAFGASNNAEVQYQKGWSDFATHLRTSLAESEVSPKNIYKVKTPEELEIMTIDYVNIIREACEQAIPKPGSAKKSTIPPWWSKDLKKAKAEVKRKKRRIRNAAPERRQSVVNEYVEAKLLYTEKANCAATALRWKEFCNKQERESMWDGVYRVIRKTAGRHED